MQCVKGAQGFVPVVWIPIGLEAWCGRALVAEAGWAWLCRSPSRGLRWNTGEALGHRQAL